MLTVVKKSLCQVGYAVKNALTNTLRIRESQERYSKAWDYALDVAKTNFLETRNNVLSVQQRCMRQTGKVKKEPLVVMSNGLKNIIKETLQGLRSRIYVGGAENVKEHQGIPIAKLVLPKND